MSIVLVLCPVVSAQSAPVDKGALNPGAPVSDTIDASTTHRYTLSMPDNTPFTLSTTIEPADASVFTYLLDADSSVITPSGRSYADNVLVQVYGCPHAPCVLLLDGEGSYTVSLTEGDTLHPTGDALETGTPINGQLASGQKLAYTLEQPDEKITLTLTQDKQPVYAQVIDAAGTIYPPLFEAFDGIKGTRVQVFALDNAAAPVAIELTGAGKFTLQADSGDKLRFDTGTLAPGNTLDEFKSPTGFAVYVLDNLAGDAISVGYGGGARNLYVQDATGQRLYADTTFFDRTNQQSVDVFHLTGTAPYSLTVQAENAYTLSLMDGDLSQLEPVALDINTVMAVDTPSGMNPVFTLDKPDESTLITLIFSDRTVLNRIAPEFRGSDGTLITPENLVTVTNGVLIQGLPVDACPCTFLPRISGKFAISVSGDTPELTVPVSLTQSEVNLRAGANLRAPIIAIGANQQVLQAFARSADDAWLLALTDSHLVVWVFRQLTAPVADNIIDTLPVIEGAGTAEATVTPTPTLTVTATPLPDASASPVKITATVHAVTLSPTPATTGTPLPTICTVKSGGGINMRSGAGMEFLVAGSMSDGDTAGVIAQSYDSDGNIWWQLEGGAWVRADVVSEIGKCQNAPVIRPASR